MQVPIAWMDGHLWVRISAQIYNTLEDYETLAKAIENMMQEGRKIPFVTLNGKEV
jgi:hypothetical protein